MLGFIVAIVAGFVTPQAETALARPVAGAISGVVEIEEGEMRLLAFMLVMLIAGIISVLIDSGSVFWVLVGGVLGYFGTRLVAAARKAAGN